MAKIVEISKYWPAVVSDIREFKALAAVDDPELTAAWQEVENIFNDQYIMTATETGLVKYEAALGIRPATGDTFEARRFKALTMWADSVPYTWRTLLERLNALSGSNNYEISLDAPGCEITLVTHLGVPGAVDEVNAMLDQVTPVNIALNVSNLLAVDAAGGITLAAVAVSGIKYTLTADLYTTYSASGSFNNPGVSVIGSTIVIS